MPPELDADPVLIQFTHAEALVLFEWLSRVDSSALQTEHLAELTVLYRLEGKLEPELVEPFKPNYRELLAAARAEVVGENAAP